MKTKLYARFAVLTLFALSTINHQLTTCFAQGTAFSYQGRLNTNGVPTTGLYDFQFYLRDALTAGNPVGTTNTLAPVGVTNGVFFVTLDFSNGIFNGASRWLEIAVRTNGSTSFYTNLTPRQPLLPVPYAITASNLTGTLSATQLSGSLPSSQLSGTYSSAVNFSNAANSFAGNGGGVTNLNATNLVGTINDARLSTNVALLTGSQTFTGAKAFSAEVAANNNIRLNGSNIWFLGGSDFTHGLGYYGTATGLNKFFGASNPDGPVLFGFGGGALGSINGGAHAMLTWTPQQVFINSTNAGSWVNAVAFIENRSTNNVNAAPAQRLQATGNLVDGVLSVSSTTGTGYIARFGNASGYLVDIATNGNTTLAGALVVDNANGNTGSYNPGLTFGSFSGEGIASKRNPGGNQYGLDFYTGNTLRLSIANGGNIDASALIQANGGVRVNQTNIWFTGDANHGLGYFGATRPFAGAQPDGPVLFGYSGGALGSEQFGTEKIALSWDANGNVGIGRTNPQAALDVNGTVKASTLVGGEGTSAGDHAAVAGGKGNVASGAGAFVGGGGYDGVSVGNLGNTASGMAAVVGGGVNNTASGIYPTVGGGDSNLSGNYGAVGGGQNNQASGQFATVAGGGNNIASGIGAFVGGGGNSSSGGFDANIAAATLSTICGGTKNQTYAFADYATIAGGFHNQAYGTDSAIGGGEENAATKSHCTVGGGFGNHAEGVAATVPGGLQNDAVGDYSFAAGNRAKANAAGTFVWSDSRGYTFNSGSASNSFNVRATGGVYLWTGINGSGVENVGAVLGANSTSWASISDRNAKKNFTALDGREVLNKLSSMPVQKWNYKWESDTNTPHIGPMAQDFKGAFYPGRDDKSITTLEFDGVELAAIQGLNQKVDEKDARIQTQAAEIEALQQSVAELKKLVQSIVEKK